MAYNKIIYKGDTLIDLTADTVTPETLAEGVTAHAKNGEIITGTATGGSGGTGGEMTADSAEIYVIFNGQCLSFFDFAATAAGGNELDGIIGKTEIAFLACDELPFIGLTGVGLNHYPAYLCVTKSGDIYMSESNSWVLLEEGIPLPNHGWIDKSALEALDFTDEINVGFYAVRTVGYPMLDGTLTKLFTDVSSINGRFGHYPLLNSVDLPNVTVIGVGSFMDCYSLTSVNIPKVIVIGDVAFASCANLTKISLPDTLRYIDSTRAFNHCTKLENITYAGTVAQWNDMKFSDAFVDKVPATEVVCSDGTLSLV